MLPAKFLWGSVLLTGELQKYAKNSNFENFQSALYSTSVSMPLIGAMVGVPLPTFFAVFQCWCTKLMRRENGTKLKNLTFDLNLLLAPTRAHQVCILHLLLSS